MLNLPGTMGITGVVEKYERFFECNEHNLMFYYFGYQALHPLQFPISYLGHIFEHTEICQEHLSPNYFQQSHSTKYRRVYQTAIFKVLIKSMQDKNCE